MTTVAILQCALYMAALIGLSVPLGRFMARVFAGEPTWLHALLGPLERLLYRAAGVDPRAKMRWSDYAGALLVFNIAGLLVVYALQRLQGEIFLNPDGLGAVAPDLALNTAISFASNTDWQAYSGETTLGYAVQMLGLTVQNFVSAATGIAVLRHGAKRFGQASRPISHRRRFAALPRFA